MLTMVLGCAALSVRSDSEPRGGQNEDVETTPAPQPLNEEAIPNRPAELPAEVDEGPQDGLTLEAAVERMRHDNADLAARFQDIPKAKADVVSAGLRNNPVLFVDVSHVPYGRYSPQRPGAVQYDVTLVQAIDVNGKHKNNTRVARKMLPVLQARYQDAVRHKLEALFTAYVAVLEARAVLEAARVRLERLADVVATTRERVRKGRDKSEIAWASLRRNNARLALRKKETALLYARRNLAVVLAIPREQADDLRLRGPLRDRFPPPPCSEELIRIALQSRPDLTSARLSLDRAQAILRREKAEWLDDLFLFFSPFQLRDMSPQNKSTTATWQIGILLPIPIFDRNQGEIARARANVAQRRIEVDQTEQQAIEEVRQAATDYADSREDVRRYERELLPQARHLGADNYRRFASGDKNISSFVAAQKRYGEIVHEYLHVLAHHRLDMLRLNTAVGQRILP